MDHDDVIVVMPRWVSWFKRAMRWKGLDGLRIYFKLQKPPKSRVHIGVWKR